MSTFYGMVHGNRGAVTRCGSKNSGFKVTAQSYDGSVIINLRYNKDNILMVELDTNDSSSMCGSYSTPSFNGTFDELKQMLKLYDDIKDGKVSITHHRSESNKMKSLKKLFTND